LPPEFKPARGTTSFPGRDDFEWREVLSVLEREPHLSELNRNVAQKDLHEG